MRGGKTSPSRIFRNNIVALQRNREIRDTIIENIECSRSASSVSNEIPYMCCGICRKCGIQLFILTSLRIIAGEKSVLRMYYYGFVALNHGWKLRRSRTKHAERFCLNTAVRSRTKRQERDRTMFLVSSTWRRRGRISCGSKRRRKHMSQSSFEREAGSSL